MDDADAVASLKRLGLTTYEARAFVALQKLGAGTASEVADIADVPRSQVYGAADDLEDRGLVEVEQSNPTRYRPVGVEEARERLYRQLQSEGDSAFEYLESVREEYGTTEEETESIWTVRGTSNVVARASRLLAGAEATAVYGTDDVDHLEPSLRDGLAEAAKRDVDVTVLSENPSVLDAVSDVGARIVDVPQPPKPEMGAARVLMVDDDTVLVSVVGDDGAETAFWSSNTAFASMLTTLLDEFVADATDSET
ncbi:TrmB family transcriptional regulator [Halobacterium zhouii]|uniref:TrmB family transcriptional regulator n=1 Tax=Halobacterium zhouii TaxID=2902624 RepID=UPI001E298C20|nr:helix-turn-helix domain-containing protein [Halobacterium zhouii]